MAERFCVQTTGSATNSGHKGIKGWQRSARPRQGNWHDLPAVRLCILCAAMACGLRSGKVVMRKINMGATNWGLLAAEVVA